MIDHGPRNKWGPGPSGFGLRAQKYTMFRCVIHHQCNAERRWMKGPGNIYEKMKKCYSSFAEQ
jgi:hypothetical protein